MTNQAKKIELSTYAQLVHLFNEARPHLSKSSLECSGLIKTDTISALQYISSESGYMLAKNKQTSPR